MMRVFIVAALALAGVRALGAERDAPPHPKALSADGRYSLEVRPHPVGTNEGSKARPELVLEFARPEENKSRAAAAPSTFAEAVEARTQFRAKAAKRNAGEAPTQTTACQTLRGARIVNLPLQEIAKITFHELDELEPASDVGRLEVQVTLVHVREWQSVQHPGWQMGEGQDVQSGPYVMRPSGEKRRIRVNFRRRQDGLPGAEPLTERDKLRFLDIDWYLFRAFAVSDANDRPLAFQGSTGMRGTSTHLYIRGKALPAAANQFFEAEGEEIAYPCAPHCACRNAMNPSGWRSSSSTCGCRISHRRRPSEPTSSLAPWVVRRPSRNHQSTNPSIH